MGQVGVAVTDILTGHYAQSGILAALLKRGRTGRGSRVECSLFESQVRMSRTPTGFVAHAVVDRIVGQHRVQLPDRRQGGHSVGHVTSLDRTLSSLPDKRFFPHAIGW